MLQKIATVDKEKGTFSEFQGTKAPFVLFYPQEIL